LAATVVIPARYASTRFPAKIIAAETGRPLVQHVVDQVRRCGRVREVIVAADDERIATALRPFETKVVMTSPSHQSGTDRIAEVARGLADEIIVNVQGDEPDIDPELIDSLIDVLLKHDDMPMATVATPFAHARDIENPNLVKVVTDQRHCAIYFSRAVIPYDRDRHANGAPLGAGPGGAYRKHLGIYAYEREALLTLSTTPVCELERLEKLEQLRALYLGMKIFVQETAHAPHGVDTPEDYAAFVKRYHHGNGQANH
jgi:3-deoxy-manno-octulosonate cytidylyltransferase (CMP-KDO synthetase)